MADLSSIGDIVAGFVPEGPLRTVVLVVYGLCAAVAPFVYKYYLGVLAQGAKPEGSIERQDYDNLRASLKEGNLAARLYAKWLAKFLDWIERFFGDAGMVDRTLFPHAFGLKKPAPLWTAPAFDRCLLLALIYPIATIFLIWAISGHVGPAEAALGLKSGLSGWSRGLAAVAIGFSSFAFWRGVRTRERESSWPWIPAAVAVTVAAAYVFAGAGVAIGAGVRTFLFALAVAFVYGWGYADSLSLVGGVAASLAAVGVSWLYSIAIKHRRQGVFLSRFIPAMILACLALAELLSPLKTWGNAGPLLLFLGLLTLLNAPFDWASLGLTRALLRRGLELGSWWPTFLAIVDACLAGVIIALLALTMVIGVQAFDELAVHGGGEKAAVLPLGPLFDGIAKNPGAPEYWWAYALLLSTMIPSLINLAIGCMALTRGVPGVSRLLLHWIPEGKGVPDYKWPLAALALTIQMFAGAFLGIAAQAFLAWGLLYRLMPAVGLDLLDMARAVADFDLPARAGRLFTNFL